ncbi:UNKNOWN [Stylonychia lemnae]|uniref:Uncharacterized protein n=1 Tax=Stylonychia lemnae TaxID=5949 RepID=A0A078A8U9_STYLE|nr:UNKNOWN [Stylonychia lemnae]|eukprot:CDW77967.1 UNKNOWN [Stylonychia lemnae]
MMMYLWLDLCLIAKKSNEHNIAIGGQENGLVIVRLIQKGNCQFELIQDQKRFIDNMWVSSMMLLRPFIIAFTCIVGHSKSYLKIFDIKRKQYIVNVKLPSISYLYGIAGYDYNYNPFAFIKDDNQVSLINFRNQKIVKVVNSVFSHQIYKSQCFANKQLKKTDRNKFIFYDVQNIELDSIQKSEIRMFSIEMP